MDKSAVSDSPATVTTTIPTKNNDKNNPESTATALSNNTSATAAGKDRKDKVKYLSHNLYFGLCPIPKAKKSNLLLEIFRLFLLICDVIYYIVSRYHFLDCVCISGCSSLL